MAIGGGEHQRRELTSARVARIRVGAVLQRVGHQPVATRLCRHQQRQIGHLLRRSLRRGLSRGQGENQQRGGPANRTDDRQLDSPAKGRQVLV